MEIKNITTDIEAINWIPDTTVKWDWLVFPTTIPNTIGVLYRDDDKKVFAAIDRSIFYQWQGQTSKIAKQLGGGIYKGALSDIAECVLDYVIKEDTWKSPNISKVSPLEVFLLEVYLQKLKSIKVWSNWSYDSEGGHKHYYVHLQSEDLKITIEGDLTVIKGRLKSLIDAHNKEISLIHKNT